MARSIKGGGGGYIFRKLRRIFSRYYGLSFSQLYRKEGLLENLAGFMTKEICLLPELVDESKISNELCKSCAFENHFLANNCNQVLLSFQGQIFKALPYLQNL